MGEDQGAGDPIAPEAIGQSTRLVGFAINLIPLILTFSHPGEGTHARQEAAPQGRQSPSQLSKRQSENEKRAHAYRQTPTLPLLGLAPESIRKGS